MAPVENMRMDINSQLVKVTKIAGEDYICLTDMAKAYGAEKVVESWLRNKNTIEYLGIWESFNNSSFNSHEFVGIKNQAGLNRFNLSAKQWIAATNAKGIVAKAGRYGGTYAHKDIAFEFGTWLSPEFKLLVITEFQRLKAQEQKNIEWDAHRYLSRVNYRLHTDSIKNELLPALRLAGSKQTYVYTDEADMLNLIVFGQTAANWRKQNPTLVKSGKNQRDHASLHQLVLLANLENLNAHFITEKKDQAERITLLLAAARRQYEAMLEQVEAQKKLDEKSTD
jgi:ribosomal protein S15P/S13E